MASELPRPTSRTASRCTPQTVRGTHAFEIAGYSHHKGIGAGKFIRSATFHVGGYDWCIRYYPDGENKEGVKDCIAVYLELLNKNTEVRASFELRLMNLVNKSSASVFCRGASMLFNTVDMSKNIHTLGTSKFHKRNELESSAHLYDDRLVIECDVTVIKECLVVETTKTSLVNKAPPTLSQDLGNLLGKKEGADVNFKVEGETFTAHTIVLAMRSSVFMAEFYGPLSQQRGQRLITIEDIQPDVFQALLYFIYTDRMFPGIDELDKVEKIELTKHLLVAADRYDIPMLKFLCEKNLVEILEVETVAAMLVLADQYTCSMLKDACIEFITCTDSRFDQVVASEGYGSLKRSCPAILLDVFEKAKKSRRI